MPEKKTKSAAKAVKSRKTAAFTKQELLEQARYANRKDLLSALLEDGKTYTHEEADNMIEKFMKGKVE